MARRDEHRIIAETLVAPRRPYERPEHLALEALGLTIVRPGQGQRASEMGVVTSFLAGGLDLAPDALHRPAEVAIAGLVLGPAGGENAGQAVQRVDRQAAVVGQR